MSFDNKEELSYKEQIKKFLGDKDNYSLFIKGKWGVGKTYLWKKIENEISNTKKDFELNKIKFNLFSHLIYLYKFIVFIFKFIFKYFSYYEFVKREDKSLRVIYISLFGKEHYKEILEEITLNSFNHNKLIYFLRNLTFWKISVGSLFQFFIKQDFKNVIICFDDLERKSNKLNIKDLLGLINKLKEEKCKVILIGDDSKLNNETFNDYKEKCIDLEITINSRFEVISQIIKEKCPQISTELITYDLLFYIKNLRQLNKITRAFNFFHEELHFAERLKENPDLKEFFIYIFETIFKELNDDHAPPSSTEILELKHLFNNVIEYMIKGYFNNTYLIPDSSKESFNKCLNIYNVFIYKAKLKNILADLIQGKIDIDNIKNEIEDILKNIDNVDKAVQFIVGFDIVDFFALTYAFDLNNEEVIRIKKEYVKRYPTTKPLKQMLKIDKNIKEYFEEYLNNIKNNYLSNHNFFDHQFKEQDNIINIKNYSDFLCKIKQNHSFIFDHLLENKIILFYLSYFFLDENNQKEYKDAYEYFKKIKN